MIMAEISTDKNIIGIITSLHRGGAERKIVYLLNNDIISNIFILENKIEYEIDKNKEELIKPLILSNKIKSPLLKYLLIPFYSFIFSKKINKDSTVLSFVERADITNVFSKLFIRHKSIVTVIIDPKKAYSGLKYPLYLIMRMVYIFSDMVIVNSKGATEFLKRSVFLKNKVFTLYNPIDISFIKQKSKETLTDEEKNIFNNYPVFITAGRLTEAKGQWHLLRIFKQVKIDIPNAKLVIIGDGRLRKYLTLLSKGLGFRTFINWEKDKLNDSYDVYFLGSQENPFKFISNSSIFICPSLFEGFSNAILEALACEVPVISADCSYGPREILAPDTDFNKRTKVPEHSLYGILMPVLSLNKKTAKQLISDEEKLWAKTIIDFYNNKAVQLDYANNSLKRAKDFDMDVIIPEWKKLLNI